MLSKRKGVWYIRVTVQGREYHRSLRTADKRLAQQRAKALLDQIGRESYGGRRYTWREAVEGWAGSAVSGLKPATLARYLVSLKAVDPVLGTLHLDQIGRKQMAAIAGRPDITNASRRRDLTAVSVVLRWAQGQDWIERNPASDYPRGLIRERRDPVVLPTAAEVERLADACGPMLGAMVRLLAHTGLRVQEAATLTWRQVDLNRRVITLEHTKAGRVRAVPLDDAACRTLSGTPRRLDVPYVFWHARGRYTKAAQVLAQARSRIGVTWRTHDLRHWFAVRSLQGGMSIYDLQQVLGHGSVAVTEGYLRYLAPDEVRVAKRGVG